MIVYRVYSQNDQFVVEQIPIEDIMSVGPSYAAYPLGGNGHGKYRKTNSTSHGGAAGAPGAWAGGALAPTPSYQAIPHAGIRAGEIIGIRCWMIEGHSLYSMFAHYRWEPGEVVTGDVENGFGVHAFVNLTWLVSNYRFNPSPMAIGKVALWGEVVEHEGGYRGQFGKIIAIDEVRCAPQGILHKLRHRYLGEPMPPPPGIDSKSWTGR